MTFRNIEISKFECITITQYSRIVTYTICRSRFRSIRSHYSITNITTILLEISVKIWQMVKKIPDILRIYYILKSQKDRIHLFKFILKYDDVMSIEIFYSSISIENIRNGKKKRETKTPRKFLSFSFFFLSKKIRTRPLIAIYLTRFRNSSRFLSRRHFFLNLVTEKI